MNFLKFTSYNDAIEAIKNIDIVLGFPTETTITYYEKPSMIINNQTGMFYCYGIPTYDWMLHALTSEQINNIEDIDIQIYKIIYQ